MVQAKIDSTVYIGHLNLTINRIIIKIALKIQPTPMI